MGINVEYGPKAGDLGLLAALIGQRSNSNRANFDVTQYPTAPVAQQPQAPPAGLSDYQRAHASGYGPAHDEAAYASQLGHDLLGGPSVLVPTRAQLGDTAAAAGPSRVPTRSEYSFVNQRDKQYALDQQRIAKLFSDPRASLSGDQKADILNQLQAAYPERSFTNPIDVSRAQEESNPETKLANARAAVRNLPGANQFWETLIHVNKDGEIDFSDLIKWRGLEKETQPGKLTPAIQRAYETAKEIHQRKLPDIKNFTDAEGNVKTELYNRALSLWEAQERGIIRQYDPDAAAHLPPLPAESHPAAPDTAPAPSAPPLKLITSKESYQAALAHHELDVGDQFTDEAGRVLQIRPDGSLQVVQ